MTKTYTAIGLVCTAAYFVTLGLFAFHKIPEISKMPLNELGDFLAGAFGPLALLWLILGYFQQGIELKQNTRALELQALELKNSVEQQRELVEVSRQQFHAELEALKYERERIEATFNPRFVIGGFGGSHNGAGHHEFSCLIKNLGSTITNVAISTSAALEKMEPSSHSHWINGGDMRLKFVFQDQNITDCQFFIDYINGAGIPGRSRIEAVADFSGQYPAIKLASITYGNT